MNYAKNDHLLNVTGYEIYFTRFADSILKDHFPKAKTDLETVLTKFYIPEGDIIKGGGGLSEITQHLSQLFEDEEWAVKTIESQHYINKRIASSQEYKLDRYFSSGKGNIGLKIQWNSKDAIFHSNLEDLKQLYQLDQISIGIVITRGESLQKELFFVYQRYLEKLPLLDSETLQATLNPSAKAKADFEKKIRMHKEGAISSIAKGSVNSKFGTATTHIEKLLPFVEEGKGDPCPLILIGIGKERLQP